MACLLAQWSRRVRIRVCDNRVGRKTRNRVYSRRILYLSVRLNIEANHWTILPGHAFQVAVYIGRQNCCFNNGFVAGGGALPTPRTVVQQRRLEFVCQQTSTSSSTALSFCAQYSGRYRDFFLSWMGVGIYIGSGCFAERVGGCLGNLRSFKKCCVQVELSQVG